MKDLLVDILFVVVLICVVQVMFLDNKISKTMFERSLDEFEERIDLNQDVKTGVVISDTSDNSISYLLHGVSQICIQIMEFVVLVFSNLISMMLMNVVY